MMKEASKMIKIIHKFERKGKGRGKEEGERAGV